MKRVGVFSGTFDPVHRGHIAFALGALAQAHLDTVVFLPERSPRSKSGASDFAHRLRMLRLASRQSSALDVLALPDKQFTVAATLPELQRRFPDSQLVLLCGSDVVRTFSSRWPGLETLLAQVELAVGLRAGETQTEIELLLANLVVRPITIFIEGPHAHVSATKIRAGDAFEVDPLVREYISVNRLYQAV